MAICEIKDVDVVADGGAIVGGVVCGLLGLGFSWWVGGRKHTVTEDHQLLALAGGDLGEQGEQVVGDTLGVLTHDAGGVGTSGVEVTEQSTVPLLGLGLVAGLDSVVALSVDHVGDGGLNGNLGVTVGVGGAQRALLGDGDHVGETGGIAVDSGGAGEDNVGDVVADHRAQKVDGAVDVDHVVVQGLLAGLADGLIKSMSVLPLIVTRQEVPTLRAAKWITLSMSG